MKNWMGIVAGVVLALGLVSKTASAESFGSMMMPQQIGTASIGVSVGVSIPRPQPMPIPAYRPNFSVCGVNPCAGYMNYPMPVAYGSHGMVGGYGGGYGYGYGYGYRPMSRCGHRRCMRYTRCCNRRGYFRLGIQAPGFRLGLAIGR